MRSHYLLVSTSIIALLTAAGSSAENAAKPAAAIVRQVLTKALPDLPGKEVLMQTVEYPPGGATMAHRHHADVFVYVLEGSIVMQVAGGKEVTLRPGETFIESPGDVHRVSRNASDTQPAKFLVFYVKKAGAPYAVLAD